jgi:hypothetical protein
MSEKTEVIVFSKLGTKIYPFSKPTGLLDAISEYIGDIQSEGTHRHWDLTEIKMTARYRKRAAGRRDSS